jgi:DNA-binding HxlR family transcriptional regulator
MSARHRSRCPINLALEVFGDRWTLLIVRDLMFAGKRHFREFLQSEEAISSNILADRLRMLVKQRIVTRTDDPSHKQKASYSLTERGIAMLPILVRIGIWSRKHCPVTEKSSATAAFLETGGPRLWEEIASQLRKTHLGVPAARRS